MSEGSGKRKGARGRKPDAATRVVMAGVARRAISQASASARPVTDPGLIDQKRDFAELIRQTTPLAGAGTPKAEQAAKAIRHYTAHRHGLSPEKALEHATRRRDLGEFTKGAWPKAQVGKAAEVVAASDHRPGKVRVSPDDRARQGGDLISGSRTRAGTVFAPIAEVKTGCAKYIVKSAKRMAAEGRRELMIIDSKFLNRDGSPRVAPGAFTTAEAGHMRRAQEAGVKLRGVRDLESRAAWLCKNVKHLSPKDKERIHRGELDEDTAYKLVNLRGDIARAYRPKGVAGRAAGTAAMAAAMAAVATLVVQAVSEGKIDLAIVGEKAGKAAVWAVGETAAEAILYHGANTVGLAPEVAKSFAETGVMVAFCLFADVSEEVRAARGGEISTADAVGGSAMKAALDILPLALAPLGPARIPIFICARLGGRWAIERVRDGKTERKRRFVEDMQRADRLDARMDRLQADMRRDNTELDESDRLYEEAMADGDSK